MNTQEIRDLYDYNYWANGLILNMAEQVTPEQFTAPSSHSFVSLQGTLVHTLDSEWMWRLLLQGLDFNVKLNAADFPDVASVRALWQQEEQATRAYLDTLTDADLSDTIRYEVGGGVIRERVLWHCLFHVVNHGMQHRSEAANLLTTYGRSPGGLDFTRWLNEYRMPQK